jgi:Protein of unknown function (DUF2971)
LLVHEISTEQEKLDFFKINPPTLCKYRIWNDDFHKRVITHNELFFSSPKRFNDPYDCGLPFRQHPNNSDPIVIKLMVERSALNKFPKLENDKEAFEEKCAKQLFLILQNPESWFEMNWGLKPENLNEIFGVLSLTPDINNYLMWSHYSDSHKGFCIEFDTRKLVESIAGHFQQVHYEKEIPFISITDTLENELLTKLIYTKSSIWEYENEFRLSRIHKSDFAVAFDPESVASIHFGYSMKYEDQIEIIELVKVKYPKAKFYKMELDKETFKLNSGEIKIL